MSRIRLLWDRLTGQEAARADEIERRRCAAQRASDRDDHAREVREIRLAALEHGVLIRRNPDTWVDVTTFDGTPMVRPATWRWEAAAVDPDKAEPVRRIIEEGRG